MCSKVKGSAQSYFSSLESTTRRGSDEIHQSFVLPWGLHRAAVEIAFREGNMLKNLITIAIGKMVERLDGVGNKDKEDIPFTFDSEEKIVHTSAYLPMELIANLRKVAHYTSINKQVIIAYGLTDLLLQEYGEKYPDLVCPIKEYIIRKA